MLLRPGRRSLVVVASSIVCGHALARGLDAQPPSARTVRGRVTGPDSQPVAGASTWLLGAGGIADSARTGADGRYALQTAKAGALTLRVRAAGMPEVERVVPGADTATSLTLDVRLVKPPATLAAVKVTASRTRKPTISEINNADIGAPGASALGFGISPGDMGSIASMAAAIPGVTITPSMDGGIPGFSVLGLGASQNAVTLNGLSFGGFAIPMAAATMTRFQTTTYDPSQGGYSGALLAMTVMRGSNFIDGSAGVVVEAPALQWTDPVGARLGQRYQNVQLSVARSGPVVHDKLFYNASVQAGRRASDVATLGTDDPSALAAAGVSSENASRLFGDLDALGAPAPRLATAGATTRNASTLLRFDILPTAQRTFDVVVDGAWSASEAGQLGPTAVASRGGASRNTSAGIVVEHARFVSGRFLSRTRVGASGTSGRATPETALPDGQVLVSSILPDGRAGLATLQFGGASAFGRRNATWTAEGTNETSWYVGQKHQLKLAGGLRADGYDFAQSANRYGTYTYDSLDDLLAGRPAAFTRTLGGFTTRGDAQSAWASLGDQHRPTDRLTFQYGVRVDGARYGVGPRANADALRVFGVRTDERPSDVGVSPRLGVSWQYGHRRSRKIGWSMNGRPKGTLRAGVGLFRSTLPPTLLAAAINGTGLPDALQRLTCVGPAVPLADWRAFAADASAIPTACAGGAVQFAESRPQIVTYAPGFAPPRSWRASAGWSTTLLDRVALDADAIATRSAGQPSTQDLNFAGATRFTLGDENGRPVFVDPTHIDPATGAVDPTAMRRDVTYGRVAQTAADLSSRGEQVTVRVRPSRLLPGYGGSLTYSLAWQRDQLRGFDGAAFGDPRLAPWGTGGGDVRHTILASGYLSRGALTVSGSVQLRSGAPFTPIVSGDVNGDGVATNDRALVPNPTTIGDTAIAAAMRALLASAPAAVRTCLTRQLGAVAARNSCRGPWTAAMTVSGYVRSGALLRTARLASLGFTLSNPLAALDQLVHDDAHVRGWGGPALPSPSLLTVRGFDPATQRFRHTVNPAFGDPRPARSTLRTPFRVTVIASAPITPPQGRQRLESVVNPGRRWKGPKLTATQIRQRYGSSALADPVPRMIAAKDSLLLTQEQVTRLRQLETRYTASADSAWIRLADEIVALPDQYDRVALAARARAATDHMYDALSIMAADIVTLLTPEQLDQLAPDVRQMLDQRIIRYARDIERRQYD